MPFRRLFLALVLIVAALPAVALETFTTSELTVSTATGLHKFAIELALSEPQREQGLMFRQSMAPDHGMLFDMDVSQPISMWMKNTLIPLDMLFLDSSGRIVDIYARAVPLSTSIIASKAPARYVIELNGGTADRIGAKVGDRVTSPQIK
jgi:uncharacterized protein